MNIFAGLLSIESLPVARKAEVQSIGHPRSLTDIVHVVDDFELKNIVFGFHENEALHRDHRLLQIARECVLMDSDDSAGVFVELERLHSVGHAAVTHLHPIAHRRIG